MPQSEYMETEVGIVPTDWECVPFTDAIMRRRVSVGKVKKRDYLPFGKYPIVDQSKDFIAGYWNDSDAAFDGELPIIIFGDHTRIFKFVDFKFVCGADGTKIVQPNIERFDPYFLFCALKGIGLPSRGYNRHFKLLKEQFVPCPSLPEQRRIAAVLSAIQDAISLQVDLIHALREFKRSVMVRLLTYGAAEIPAETKMSEVGEIPIRWTVVSFDKAIFKNRYKVGKVKARDYLPFGKYPIVDQSVNFIAGYWDDSDAVYDGELPIIIFGDHTRIFKFVDFRFVCGADGTKIVQPNTERFDPLFLFYAFQNIGLPSKGYNRHFTLLKEQFLQCPPLPEQCRIAYILNIVQDKIVAEQDRKSALHEFFRSMLQQLMTGQIRLLSDEGLPL